MRRSRLVRSLTAVWAVWLGVVLLGPADMHACPTHGNHGPSHQAAHKMAAAGDMAGMAGMAQMLPDARPESAPNHQVDGQCNCVGACSLFANVVAPSAQVSIVAIDPIAEPAQVVAADDEAAPVAAPPHSRPFANGPPAVA